VFFCFDGDRAGRSAAWKALESVLPRMKDGRQAFFLFLPDGEDPDTIVRKDGADGFNRRLQQAMPLSEFFFNEMGKDVNLGTLDGKARLAERCKPMLAQIPDGAFGDLMKQRLTELTGVGGRPLEQGRATTRPVRTEHAPGPKQSLVRSAVTALLQQPTVALALAIPLRFSALDQPGVALLTELILLVHQRPDITTGAILEHFEGRDEAAALTKLALARAVEATGATALDERVLDDADKRQQTFLDAVGRLETQALQQREALLKAKMIDRGLDDAEKSELRELLAYRGRIS
jgi:DNA primase